MSISEIIKKFPLAQIPKANNLGYSKLTISFFPLPDRYISYGEDETPNAINTDKFRDYKGWQAASLELIDDKVVSIDVQYDNTVKWKNLLEFTTQTSESLNLPKSWQSDSTAQSQYTQNNYLNCDGFRVESRMTGQTNPTMYFVDLEAPKMIKLRKSSLEEKEKKTFKP